MENSSKITALVKSRRFWVALSGLAVVLSDSFVGQGVTDPELVQQLTLLGAAWIVGDSLRKTE